MTKFTPRYLESLFRNKYQKIDQLLGELFGITLPMPKFNYVTKNETGKLHHTMMSFNPEFPDQINVNFPNLYLKFIEKGKNQNVLFENYIHEEGHRRHFRINNVVPKLHKELIVSNLDMTNLPFKKKVEIALFKTYVESVAHLAEMSCSVEFGYKFNYGIEELSQSEYDSLAASKKEEDTEEAYGIMIRTMASDALRNLLLNSEKDLTDYILSDDPINLVSQLAPQHSYESMIKLKPEFAAL